MALAGRIAVLDRRDAARHTGVLAIGKITLVRREMFCIVRDISERGMRIDTRHALVNGDRVTIEMRGLDPCAAIVLWCDGESVGLAFDRPQQIDRSSLGERDGSGYVPRAPRFAVDRMAHLRLGSIEFAAEVVNVSAGGARLRAPGYVRLDGAGQLFVDGLRDPVAGYVRWALDTDIGFRFAPTLDRKTLLSLID